MKNINLKLSKTILLLGLLLFLSCEKLNDKNNLKDIIDVDQSDLYFPLKVGNYWDYGTHINKITDKYKIEFNNQKIEVYSLVTIVNSKIVSDMELLFSYDKDGNIYINGGIIPKDALYTNSLYLMDSSKEGMQWDYNETGFSGVGGELNQVYLNERKMECFVNDTIISTMAGEFTCKGFRSKYLTDGGQEVIATKFYSKGVG